MTGYESNAQCVLDYLALFQALSDRAADAGSCRAQWAAILERERSSSGVRLAPPLLRRRFRLNERDFLLVMAALALEMDGGLRNAFRRSYGLSLPTVEYGLQLISPICPSGCQALAGKNTLCGLLLTTAEPSAYPLERPLILCRTALAFLTNLSAADIPACMPRLEDGTPWLPLHREALEQVMAWRGQGEGNALYLCGPAGSGRRTLLRRACGNIVELSLAELAELSPLDQDHGLREAAALAVLLDTLICALPDSGGKALRALEGLCRNYAVPLAVLAEDDGALEGAREVVRLPPALSAGQRRQAWALLVPQSEPDAEPRGAMTVGAVRETARLALRSAAGAGREAVTAQDTRRALLQRGGALEFGIRYQLGAALDDMILPDSQREQLELICQAALCADRLAAWGIPRQREGVTAVFHGPSGTGKTMAASAIAHRLGMPLLRADLSQLMDKYVGETEKHLGRLLRSARENRCVLLFDEADALFGKRASVSTGQDKYANLSTSYLLQEIEQYDGVAILSTNLLGNFDDAFLRRLHYIVRFSLPDAALREALWRQVLPEERCGEALPYAALAQVELSPARILAAARGTVVAAMAAGRSTAEPGDVVRALRMELEKDSRALPRELSVWLKKEAT